VAFVTEWDTKGMRREMAASQLAVTSLEFTGSVNTAQSCCIAFHMPGVPGT